MIFLHFSKKKKSVVILSLVVLGVTVAALGGLFRPGPLSEAEFRRVSINGLVSRKEKSLESWKSRRIGEEGAAEYALARTSLVISGPSPFLAPFTLSHSERDESSANSDSESAEPDSAGGGAGTATAIASDGYWLTAAHAHKVPQANRCRQPARPRAPSRYREEDP